MSRAVLAVRGAIPAMQGPDADDRQVARLLTSVDVALRPLEAGTQRCTADGIEIVAHPDEGSWDAILLTCAVPRAVEEVLWRSGASMLALVSESPTARYRALLARCDAVVCSDEALAEGLTAGETLVIPPLVPDVTAVPAASARRGVLHLGRWATEPMGATETSLRRIDRAAPLTVLGEDVSPVARVAVQLRPDATLTRDLDDAVRSCRIAVCEPTPARVAELSAAGLPHAAEVDATLLRDDAMWLAASEALQRTAADRYDRETALDAWTGLLGVGRRQASIDVARRPGPLEANWAVRQVVADEILAPLPLGKPYQRQAQEMLTEQERYELWVTAREPVASDNGWSDRVGLLERRPLISVCVPTWNTDPVVLQEAIDSVTAQVYPNWELCIADDCSTSAETLAVLSAAAADPRIRFTQLDEPGGIAGATNAAFALATGEFVGLLDHDDVLQPDALYWVARLLDVDPTLDLIYSDEDKLDFDGERTMPFWKPTWSPELLTVANYITHFLVVRRTLLDEVGGIATGYDGAQDYELLLRLTELTDRIAHIPKPIYSWRMVEGSTSVDVTNKPAAHDAGVRALTAALERRATPGVVDKSFGPTTYRPRLAVRQQHLVSIVIPTRDRVDLLRQCVASIRRHTPRHAYELVIVDNQSEDPATLAYLDTLDATVVRYPHPFNYARQMNMGAAAADGDMLLLLNNDTLVQQAGWLTAMLEFAQQPEIAMVGARLLLPDGSPQSEGIGLGVIEGPLDLVFTDWPPYGQWVRNAAAVTAACAMVRATVFAEVGGFDENLAVSYNDVDLCLRMGERGYRHVYTPFARITHARGSSRGLLHPDADVDYYEARWGLGDEWGSRPVAAWDPYVNPNYVGIAPPLYRF